MERIETLNAPNFYDGLDAAVAELQNRGLDNVDMNVPITIILKTTGEVNWQGQKVCNVLTYIDANDDEILSDLDEN